MNPEPSPPSVPVQSASHTASITDSRVLPDEEGFHVERRRTLRNRRSFHRRARLSVVLFLATCATTFLAGFWPGRLEGALAVILISLEYALRTGGLPPFPPALVANGVTFSACLMGILFAHEMGHFLLALRHRVPATLPFFIPLPFGPFGTMGAVILQDGTKADRRKLFDIAVAGPLAGLAVALPVLWYGVSISSVETFEPGGGYGNPLLLEWLVALIHRPLGPGEDILLNAPLFAGWVGIFITALNLIPVGQLDGGHILYTLIGRRAHYVAYTILAAAVSWMAFGAVVYGRPPSYIVMMFLLFLMGPKHPPTADDTVRLGPARTTLGWLALSFFVVGFTPTPMI